MSNELARIKQRFSNPSVYNAGNTFSFYDDLISLGKATVSPKERLEVLQALKKEHLREECRYHAIYAHYDLDIAPTPTQAYLQAVKSCISLETEPSEIIALLVAEKQGTKKQSDVFVLLFNEKDIKGCADLFIALFNHYKSVPDINAQILKIMRTYYAQLFLKGLLRVQKMGNFIQQVIMRQDHDTFAKVIMLLHNILENRPTQEDLVIMFSMLINECVPNSGTVYHFKDEKMKGLNSTFTLAANIKGYAALITNVIKVILEKFEGAKDNNGGVLKHMKMLFAGIAYIKDKDNIREILRSNCELLKVFCEKGIISLENCNVILTNFLQSIVKDNPQNLLTEINRHFKEFNFDVNDFQKHNNSWFGFSSFMKSIPASADPDKETPSEETPLLSYQKKTVSAPASTSVRSYR